MQLRNKTFRLPADLIRRAQRKALAEERSLSQVVVELLREYVGSPRSGVEAMSLHVEQIRRKLGGRRPAAYRWSRDSLYEREDVR